MLYWCNSHQEDRKESLITAEALQHSGAPLVCLRAPQRQTERTHTGAHLQPAAKGSFGDAGQLCPWKWALEQVQKSRRASGSCTGVERSVATIPHLAGQSSSTEVAEECTLLFVLHFNFSSLGCPQFSHTHLPARLRQSIQVNAVQGKSIVSLTHNRSEFSYKSIMKSTMFPTCLFLQLSFIWRAQPHLENQCINRE